MQPLDYFTVQWGPTWPCGGSVWAVSAGVHAVYSAGVHDVTSTGVHAVTSV